MKTKFTGKIFLALLLCGAMLLGVLPLTSFGDVAMTEVDIIGFVEPTLGQTVGENLAGVTVPAGAGYSIIEAVWLNDSLGEIMNDDDVFETDTVYYAGFYVVPDGDGVFDSVVTITINGSTETVDEEFSGLNDEGALIVFTVNYTFDDPNTNYIYEIELVGYTDPVVGQKPADVPALTAAEDAPYYIVGTYWWNDTDGNAMANDEVFELGKKYSCCITLDVNGEYVFKNDADIFIDGSDAKVDWWYSGYDTDDGVFYVWTLPGYAAYDGETQMITEVDVYLDQIPAAGDASMFFSPYCDDTNGYVVTDSYWYDYANEKAMDWADAFAGGNTYSLCITVEAIPGFEFAENVTITINGSAALVAEGSALPTFQTTPIEIKPAIEAVLIEGFEMPKVGETAGENLAKITLPEGVLYTFTDTGVRWRCYDGEDDNVMDDTDTFRAGMTYYAVFNVVPLEGESFGTNLPMVLINGTMDLVDSEYSRFDTSVDGAILFFTVDIVPVGEDPSVTCGDVNKDGEVNKKDSLRLKQYLAGFDVECDLDAADVNADGTVNKKDSLRLKQWLAGFDVTLGA